MTNRRPNTRPDRGPGVGLVPVPGIYKRRLVKDGPWVPAKVWFGPPRDPDTGELLDRAHRLQCLVAGEPVDPWQVWPLHPVDQAEYDRLLEAMPDDPRRPRELGKQMPLF